MTDHNVLKKLYRYCAYQDRCSYEVRGKLRKLEVPKHEYDSYLQQLIIEKFLDDYRFAESYARGKFFNNKWGPNKIRLHLRQKDISDQLISKSLKSISKKEILFCIEQLLSKRANDSHKNRQYLYNKGFSISDIDIVLNRK